LYKGPPIIKVVNTERIRLQEHLVQSEYENLCCEVCVLLSQTGSLKHNTSHEELGTEVSTGEPDSWIL